ncbi:MAG TPA: tetratricopeptide repeat protein [Pyrinomonadaceae bacterium]|nr:tetratricopeptide repeat protein [Pyrinomonadaceae bacterium]
MKIKKQWQKSLFALVLMWTFLLTGFPAQAQDIVTSSDLGSGSSVFVFRVSRKAPQGKAAFRSVSTANRSTSQKTASRQKIVRQSTAIAKVVQKSRPTKRIDPQTFAKLSVNIKQISPKEGSLIFAGAGEYYLERDDIDQGIDFFNEAVKLDESNQFARLGLSDAFTRKGHELLEKEEIKKALQFFEEAIKYDDKNATAYTGLGEIYDSLDQDKEAIENYENALRLNAELTEIYAPLGILYYHQGEVAKAENYLTKALATNPEDAETQYFLGLVRYKQTRYADAETALRRSVAIDANNPEAHYYLAEVFSKLNREQDAIASYKKAVEINPKFVEAWFDLGAAYYNNENYESAVDAYKKVIQNKNDYFQAYANLGDVYRQMNQLDQAIGQYQIASARITDDAQLYSSYGFILGRQGKWNAAIDVLEKAVSVSPDFTDYTNLGWAYFNAAQDDVKKQRPADARAKLQKGREALQKSLQLNPKFVPAALNLGVINNELQDYRATIEIMERTIDLADNRSVKVLANNELGIAYYGLGDFKKAAKSFRRAVELDGKFVPAVYSLGESEFRDGNTKEAEKAIATLQQLGATNYARRLQAIMLSAGKQQPQKNKKNK